MAFSQDRMYLKPLLFHSCEREEIFVRESSFFNQFKVMFFPYSILFLGVQFFAKNVYRSNILKFQNIYG